MATQPAPRTRTRPAASRVLVISSSAALPRGLGRHLPPRLRLEAVGTAQPVQGGRAADVIVVDASPPIADPLETTLHQLRADYPGVPVVVVASDAPPGARALDAQLREAARLTKPGDYRDLARRITALCADPAARVEDPTPL